MFTQRELVQVSQGDLIYNRGDMANPSHWVRVDKVWSDNWGTHVNVTPMKKGNGCPSDRDPYQIEAVMIHDVDKGNGLTRFVTEEAYNTFRERSMIDYHIGAGRMIIKVYDENGQRTAVLSLRPEDVEEALLRCGWTVLNDAEGITQTHRVEIDRCDKNGAEMTIRKPDEAVKWWNARKLF